METIGVSSSEISWNESIRKAIQEVLPEFQKAFLVAQLSRVNGSAAEELKERLLSLGVDNLIEINEVDVTQDIARLYLVKGSDGILHGVIVVDPFELYFDPYVAGTMPDWMSMMRSNPNCATPIGSYNIFRVV